VVESEVVAALEVSVPPVALVPDFPYLFRNLVQ
jgi:hypothetical protein